MPKRVAVIGGGISGLAAAYKLSQTPHEVHLFEAEGAVGGKLQTLAIDGFLVETAADSFVASRPRIVELAHELGLENELIRPVPGKRAYIHHNNQLHEIPQGFSGLVPTLLKPLLKSRLLTPMGKLRLLAEMRISPRLDDVDESLESFAVRRFGREAYDRLFEPLMSGVNASGGDRLSVRAAFPHWKTAELEYGSVMRGILTKRERENGHPRVSGFLSFRNGMSTLVQALEHRLLENGVQTHLATAVTGLRATGKQFTVSTAHESSDFDGVVLALPGPIAARLCDGINPELANPILEVGYSSQLVVSLGYHDPAVKAKLKGTGYLVPAISQRLASGTTFSSEKWEGRAPEESSLVRVYLGRRPDQNLMDTTDAELGELARAELLGTTGITQTPDLVHVSRWQNSAPQFNIGHLKLIETMEMQLGNSNGLAICGSMLRGIGIPVCVISGEVAAQHVADNLAN